MKSQKTTEQATKTIKPSISLEEQPPIETLDTIHLLQSSNNDVSNYISFENDEVSEIQPEVKPEEPKEAREHGQVGSAESPQNRNRGMAGLAIILSQLVAYFSNRADVDDIDVFSFSLHHLFCRIDFLYQTALPNLSARTTVKIGDQISIYDLLSRQRTWTDLQAIKSTLNRMGPLCHLLSNATECILDALDMTSEAAIATENQLLQHLQEDDDHSWMHTLNQERWDQALTALTTSLESWQDNRSKFIPFTTQFAHLSTNVPTLSQLDEAFNIILVSAEAIFGDILPGFQAIARHDDEAVATLLFDLMQQTDQLLVQFDGILEPLHTLIEQYSVKTIMH